MSNFLKLKGAGKIVFIVAMIYFLLGIFYLHSLNSTRNIDPIEISVFEKAILYPVYFAVFYPSIIIDTVSGDSGLGSFFFFLLFFFAVVEAYLLGCITMVLRESFRMRLKTNVQ